MSTSFDVWYQIYEMFYPKILSRKYKKYTYIKWKGIYLYRIIFNIIFRGRLYYNWRLYIQQTPLLTSIFRIHYSIHFCLLFILCVDRKDRTGRCLWMFPPQLHSSHDTCQGHNQISSSHKNTWPTLLLLLLGRACQKCTGCPKKNWVFKGHFRPLNGRKSKKARKQTRGIC